MNEQFYGVWSLTRCTRHYRDGRSEFPFGEKPVGRLSYDRAGRVSAQAMRPGRKSAEESGGYVSYFGSFRVVEASHQVVHHVVASLQPSWVGTDLVRSYRFESGQLILIRAEGDETDELTWTREV